MAAIQLAKQAGATVISTASSDEKLERLKELGLDHGINYASESFVDRVRELTDGRGVDVVLDSIGGQNLVDSVERARLPGNAGQRRRGRPGRLGHRGASLWTKNNTLRGVYLGGALLAEYPRIHQMIADLLGRVAAGELHVEIEGRSRCQRPPPRTSTSRAATPSGASCWRPDQRRLTARFRLSLARHYQRLLFCAVLTAVDHAAVAQQPQEHIRALHLGAGRDAAAAQLRDLDHLVPEIDPLADHDLQVVEGLEPRLGVALERLEPLVYAHLRLVRAVAVDHVGVESTRRTSRGRGH